jgi:integrase
MNARKLPVRMHEKNGAYYYVFRNKWTFLSRDKAEAFRMYSGTFVEKRIKGLADLSDAFLSKYTGEPSTVKLHTLACNKIKKVFAEFEPSDLKPSHIYALMDATSDTPAMANQYVRTLRMVLSLGIRKGLIEHNVATEIDLFPSTKRTRNLTIAEFELIKAHCQPTLRAILDICYLTGQRIGDVLKIKYADFIADGLYVKQQKTGHELIVKISPDLEAAIRTAKSIHQSVRGLTLFHTRKGTQLAYNTIRTQFMRALEKSGVKGVTLHDIRATAAGEAKKQGIDGMGLLGHKEKKTHAGYLREHTIPVVDPVKFATKS